MGWRFRQSKKIGPFRVTASKSGLSYSGGIPGARYTVRADGKQQISIGIPGSGISYTEVLGKNESEGPGGGNRAEAYTASVECSASASGELSVADYISEELDKIEAERSASQTAIFTYIVLLLFCSPVILLFCLIPLVNAILGIALSIPFFIAASKMRGLDERKEQLYALLENAESYEDEDEDEDEEDDTETEDSISALQRRGTPDRSTEIPCVGFSPATASLDAQIKDAEAKLEKASNIFGDDHPKVADCLDELASLLRLSKIRTLDAANMEARARVIRASRQR